MERTKGRYSQGTTLVTSTTQRWSKEKFSANNEIEQRIIVVDFSAADQGRSRKRIAVCDKKEDAAHIVECVNSHDKLIEDNKKLRSHLRTLIGQMKEDGYENFYNLQEAENFLNSD